MRSRSEAEGEDIVDSDFSIDENDEVISDTENADEDKPKRKSVYKVSVAEKRINVSCFLLWGTHLYWLRQDPKALKPTTSKKVDKINKIKTVEKRKTIKEVSSLDKSSFGN